MSVSSARSLCRELSEHRLSACKSLGWEDIEVNIVELTELDAELAEIDENLIRNELHWFDRDKQIARRKEIYEKKNNILKHGGDRKSILPQIAKSKPNNSELISSFTADTAKKIGRSVDTVEQSVKRANLAMRVDLLQELIQW